jgi:hypothetical protein
MILHYANDFSTPARCAEFVGLRTAASTNTPLQCVTEGGETFARIATTSSFVHWFDPNHISFGLGGLFVLAAAASQEVSNGPIPALRDLRGSELRVRMRVSKLQKPATSKLLFWFQTSNPDADAPVDASGWYSEYLPRVNYVCTDQDLSERLGFGKSPSRIDYVERCRWVDFVIPFDGIEAHWDCLGGSTTRTRDQPNLIEGVYQCASSVDSALSSWSLNMGFVLLHPGSTSRPALETIGNIELASFAIWKP